MSHIVSNGLFWTNGGWILFGLGGCCTTWKLGICSSGMRPIILVTRSRLRNPPNFYQPLQAKFSIQMTSTSIFSRIFRGLVTLSPRSHTHTPRMKKVTLRWCLSFLCVGIACIDFDFCGSNVLGNVGVNLELTTATRSLPIPCSPLCLCPPAVGSCCGRRN